MKKREIKHIAVDFDGTLVSDPNEKYPEIGKQKWIHKWILNHLIFHQSNGVYVIVNTLREGEALERVKGWCYAHDFYPDNFNDNDPRLTEKWGYSRKIAADVYIDDRNFGLFGWLLRRFG